VYFTPSGYEEISDAEHYERLKDAFSTLLARQLLTVHGDVLTDHRGERYCLKDEVCGWAELTIKDLSEEIPTNAIRSDRLSKEQISEIKTQAEKERIASLSTEIRRAEKEAKLALALSVAAQKRSEYEIYGAENPLELSRKWYAEEVAKLETLYG
jgi:hemin uptake protein HemP